MEFIYFNFVKFTFYMYIICRQMLADARDEEEKVILEGHIQK